MSKVSAILLGAMTLAVAAPPAEAQVYPDRIATKARAIAEAYQRRSRDDSREEQTERTTKTLRLGGSGSIDLGNIAGDITVTRGGGSDATVEIVKTARGRDVADAREMLQLVQVEVSERSGRADVKTHYPNGDEWRRNNRRNVNVSVAYTVTAPAGTRVSIESISGNIKVTDIKGDITAGTVSGDVRISGAGRVGSAKSISGTIEISDAQVEGALEASSVSGDVILRRIRAGRIAGGSVSGSIKLEDVQSDEVSAHTTSGEVYFSGALARRGRYELKSFSGEVRLTLSGNTGFEIDANSFSGDIRSDLTIAARGTDSNGRRPRRTILKGTYGDGSAVLDITTFSGSIVIAKR
ncbi:MAG TPA: DUF4097 family beta strand repeat-containing protein [Vicinamibacterales bacterium]|nr:DUF4097 family beta strand repeat-containing protein [Vicinamibacterales bacterium]